MMHIDIILDRISNLPEASRNRIKVCIEEVAYEKNVVLLKSDRIEPFIYFIKKGVVRAYSVHNDGEITFWFGEEGETILSMKSYVHNMPSYENIELLEKCQLYRIRISELQTLYHEDIHIANWGRKLAENELVKIESRLISRELLSAKQRYDELMAHQSSLLQRVALKYIASYLGITPVSLSRIRKER